MKVYSIEVSFEPDFQKYIEFILMLEVTLQSTDLHMVIKFIER